MVIHFYNMLHSPSTVEIVIQHRVLKHPQSVFFHLKQEASFISMVVKLYLYIVDKL
jgi:hypothetical protein